MADLPRSRRLASIAVGLVPALLTLAPAADAATSVAAHTRSATDTYAAFPDYSLTASRNRYVVIHAWQTDRLRALKAANPNVRVLMYKNAGFAMRAQDGLASTGVSYQQADEQHPEWFLTNGSGSRITSGSYGYLWLMDVGSPGYQRAWADNVAAEVVRNPWDGVFLDDVNTTTRYHYPVDQVTKYPSNSSYQDAVESLLGQVGPRLKGTGKLAIANIGSWAENPSVGDRWLQYLSGGEEEMFTKWVSPPGQGYQWQGAWQRQLNSLKAAQAAGKIFLGVAHSSATDAQAARYGWASMLLGAGGKAAFALHADYTNETWFPEYEYDIGEPTAPESVDANGVHRRAFQRGLVLVNPTGGQLAVSFGAILSGSGLTDASSVTMAPHTGLVLMGSSVPVTAPVSRKPGKRRASSSALNVDSLVPRSLSLRRAGRRLVLRWKRPRTQVRVRYRIIRDGRRIRTTRHTWYRNRTRRARRFVVCAMDRAGRRGCASRRVRRR